MKTLMKIGFVLAVIGGGCAIGYFSLRSYFAARNKPHFREAKVTQGEIEWVINSSGTVQPVVSVQVGSFVSGPIVAKLEAPDESNGEGGQNHGTSLADPEAKSLLADFNQEVKKGELLAKIDPLIYQANVDRDKAMLNSRIAEVGRVQAMLDQAINDEKRANSLQQENTEEYKYISDMEIDKYVYARKALDSQLLVAKAAIEQARSNLTNSQKYLDYTDIRSPVDGIIIDRKIDEGQTLTAQFQTPELFVVAPRMREEMHVFASVDEADIGLIRKAQEDGRAVQFTVEAYREDLFEGEIYQIRLNPTTTQNVVTYPVVVSAANPDLKLLPGMTANLSFHVEKHENVLRVPNAALRFYPKQEHVRPADRKLLEGTAEEDAMEEEAAETAMESSAGQKVEVAKKSHRRHVWAVDGQFLKAIEIVTGINDYKYTEVVSGDLKKGQKLVTGEGLPTR